MAHTRKKMFYAPKAFNGYGPLEPPIPAAQDRPGRYPCPCCGQITLPVPPEGRRVFDGVRRGPDRPVAPAGPSHDGLVGQRDRFPAMGAGEELAVG